MAFNTVAAWVLVGLVLFPLGVILPRVGSLVLFPLGAFIISGEPFNNPITAVVMVPFLLGLFPRLALFVADIRTKVVLAILGERIALAEQRVVDLEVQRDDVLAAVANERRRIERNLHDGVQQQLVAIGLDLSMAERHLVDQPDTAKQLLDSARQKVQGSIGELRQLGRGLHPAILGDRGLDAALSATISSMEPRVLLHLDAELDLDRDTEETIYFIVSEALANVSKHASADTVQVTVVGLGKAVRVLVIDDGVGGAELGAGTGLHGIRSRVNAVDGQFVLTSPIGGPTTLNLTLPQP